MALHVHRSNRVERLVDALAQTLDTLRPADPFEPLPVVVGSRGMERWLRHELATRVGVAAQLAFPFPRQAFDGAVRRVQMATQREEDASERPAESPVGRFWEPNEDDTARDFQPDRLTFRLVSRLRARRLEPDFEAVRAYLGPCAPDQSVSARELSFCREVADTLDRLMHDRFEEALCWAAAPPEAPGDYRWLAWLLKDIGAGEPASPAQAQATLERLEPGPELGALCIFGLSTLGPGDRTRISALARRFQLHLFLMAPSERYWQDVLTHREGFYRLQRETDPHQREQLHRELASQNALLASLGLPSRDLQVWLEEVGYEDDRLTSDDPAPLDGDGLPPSDATWLTTLQSWILGAGPREELALRLAALPKPPERPLATDSSLAFHKGYGPMRQCEALRDELLACFDADPSLEPRHVIVMTPDVETYAPLVAAVFARRGVAVSADDPGAADVRLPAIPAAISDLGLSRTNPIAEVLLSVVAAAGERVTASHLVTLLGLEPIRRRFNISAEDGPRLIELVLESGMRWGFDAADRQHADQPPLDGNTLGFGADRLALGVLMPEESPPQAPPAGAASNATVSPYAIHTRDGTRRAGTLIELIRHVQAFHALMRVPGTAAEWQERLRAVLTTLTATTAATSWYRTEVEVRLDRFVDEARHGAAPVGPAPRQAEPTQPSATAVAPASPSPPSADADRRDDSLRLSRDAVHRWLKDDFELPQRGDRPITGAVTVCALQPMRSVPFRIVALLGMDDGAFPRGATAKTWDPFSIPKPHERDRREIDRHLLLEAILSARERFLVFWSGFDVSRGDSLPAAVPIEELLELLNQATPADASGEAPPLVYAHPLQPWGLGPDAGRSQAALPPPAFARPVFDRAMADAAATVAALRQGARRPTPLGLQRRGEPLVAEPHPPRVIQLDRLSRDLLRLQRVFLADRLGVRLPGNEAEIPDREPIEADSLSKWGVRNEALNYLLDPAHTWLDTVSATDALVASLRGRGLLPLQITGRRLVQDAVNEASEICAVLANTAGNPHEALELSIAVTLPMSTAEPDPPTPKPPTRHLLLTGRVESVREDGEGLLLDFPSIHGADDPRIVLRAWLHLLAARAMEHPVLARIVGKGGRVLYLTAAMSPAQAHQHLTALAGLYDRARREPLPFFQKSSHALADAIQKQIRKADTDNLDALDWDKLAGAFASAFFGASFRGAVRPGDVDKPYVKALFEDLEPREALAETGPTATVELALNVWRPALDAQSAGKKDGLKARWEIS